MRGDSGVAGEGRVVDIPKFHSWGKCTTPLTNINSDRISNASSGLCIILGYIIFYYIIYAGPLSCILGCNFLSFFLSCYDHDVQQRYLANSLSTHRHFSTKLILITTRSSTTNRCLHSFNFTLVNKSHSQHSVAAVRCEGRHFVILYACAQVFLFPDQILRSLVWERD